MESKIGTLQRLSELDPKGTGDLLLDGQEIKACLEHVGLAFRQRDITGVLVMDDYGEVWVTEYARPYALRSVYERVL